MIGANERAAIAAVIKLADSRPVDVLTLLDRLETPEGKQAHMEHMTLQTITLQVGYLVSYSVETGHPAGRCRHMSISTDKVGCVPNPDTTWMVASAYGFSGGLEACTVYWEKLRGHGYAVNVVQPFPS